MVQNGVSFPVEIKGTDHGIIPHYVGINQEEEGCVMRLTLEVSPETVQRVEQAKSQGVNMDALLCVALEHWFSSTTPKDVSSQPFLISLAGSYEGEAWDELLSEIARNRRQETEQIAEDE